MVATQMLESFRGSIASSFIPTSKFNLSAGSSGTCGWVFESLITIGSRQENRAAAKLLYYAFENETNDSPSHAQVSFVHSAHSPSHSHTHSPSHIHARAHALSLTRNLSLLYTHSLLNTHHFPHAHTRSFPQEALWVFSPHTRGGKRRAAKNAR